MAVRETGPLVSDSTLCLVLWAGLVGVGLVGCVEVGLMGCCWLLTSLLSALLADVFGGLGTLLAPGCRVRSSLVVGHLDVTHGAFHLSLTNDAVGAASRRVFGLCARRGGAATTQEPGELLVDGGAELRVGDGVDDRIVGGRAFSEHDGDCGHKGGEGFLLVRVGNAEQGNTGVRGPREHERSYGDGCYLGSRHFSPEEEN